MYVPAPPFYFAEYRQKIQKEMNVEKELAEKQMKLILSLIKWAMIIGMVIFAVVILLLGGNRESHRGADNIIWTYLLIPFGLEILSLFFYHLFIKKAIANSKDAKPHERLFAGELMKYAIFESWGMVGLMFAFVMKMTFAPDALAWYIRYFNFIHPAIAVVIMLSLPQPSLKDAERQPENPYA